MKSTLIIIFNNSYDRMLSSRFIRVQETNISAQIFTRERVRVIIFSHYLYHILLWVLFFFVGGGTVDGMGKEVRPRLTTGLRGGPHG
jgi:hypothetical protein